MKRIAILFLCVATSVFSDEWSVTGPSFDLILQPPIATTTGNNVFLTYDSVTGQILATWGDATANPSHPPPTYSFYNGTSWSSNGNNPLTIPGSTAVNSDLYTAFNPTTGQFLATWADSDNFNYPTYSIYTPGSGWSNISTINTSATSGDYRVYCIYNPVSNTFMASWEDSAAGKPYYAIYSSGWSSPTQISTTVIDGADVYLSCNPNTGDILATWRTTGKIATYSIYNGATWSSATTIAGTPTVQENILSCFDTTSGQFMAVWADNSGSDNPYYSFYNPISGWTTPSPISTTSGVDTNVAVTQNSSTGAILATWLDVTSLNQSPAYSIWNGTSWSPTAFISSAATSNSDDCFSCYDSSTGQFFATWAASYPFGSTGIPSYSIYGSSSQAPPSQPASFSGIQKKNRFGVVQEYYNTLSWEGNPSVTSYQLFRNNQLIAELSGASTYYEDHDQPRSNQLYSLVAVNAYGNSSAALAIVGAK